MTVTTEPVDDVDRNLATVPRSRRSPIAFARRRPVLSSSLALVVVLAIAAIGIPTALRAQADSAYQMWRVSVTKDHKIALDELTQFDAVHKVASELGEQLQKAWDTSDGFLSVDQRDSIHAELDAVSPVIARERPGTTSAPRAVATSESTLDELKTITRSLQRQDQLEAKALKRTATAASNLEKAVAAANGVLVKVIGAPPSKQSPADATGGLTASAATVLATWPKADDATKAALTAAAAAAQGGAAAAKPPVPLLQAYLDAAAATKKSHDAQVATELQQQLEEAQRSGASTYTDPVTGEKKKTPLPSAGGAPPATGTAPPATGPTAPAAPSGPTLRMITDGDYRGGCAVGQVVEDTDWTMGMSSGQITWHGPGAGAPWSYSQSGHNLRIWLCA